MKRLGIFLAYLSVVCLSFAPYVPTAQAVTLEDIFEMGTDPVKLDKASKRIQDTVMEVMIQLQQLLGRADNIVKERLDQVRDIVNFAIQGGSAVEAKAYSDLIALESKIMDDLNQFVFRTRCAAIATLHGDLQTAIAQALAHVAQSQPTLTILGFPVAKIRLRQVEIPAPDTAYAMARDEVFANLDKNVTDGSNAYEILSSYANLESLAEATRCVYLDKPNEITFVREQSRLELLQLPWTSGVVVLTLPGQKP